MTARPALHPGHDDARSGRGGSGGTSGATSLGRQLVTGGGWSLLGRVAATLGGLATSVLLARLVPPADVGTYLLALSVVYVAALLGSLGLLQVVVRAVAAGLGAGRSDLAWGTVRTCVRLSCAGALTVGAGYLLAAAPVAAALRSTGLTTIPLLVAAWIVVVVGQNLMTETHRGLGDFRAAAVYGGPLQGALLIGCLSTALAGGLRLGVGALVSATVVCALIGTVLGWLAVLRRFRRAQAARTPLPRVPATGLLAQAVPLLANTLLLVLLTQADLWVVSAVLPEAEVGVYGTSTRIAGVVSLPLVVANAVLAPLIADLYARGRTAQLEHTLRITALVALVPSTLLTLAFIAVGEPALRAVYGEPYAGGRVVLAVLAVAQLTSVLAGSCGLVLAMSGRQRELLAMTAGVALALPAGLIPATRAFGTTGAALASGLALALLNALWLVAARRTSGVWTHASLAPLRDLPACRAWLAHALGRRG